MLENLMSLLMDPTHPFSLSNPQSILDLSEKSHLFSQTPVEKLADAMHNLLLYDNLIYL